MDRFSCPEPSASDALPPLLALSAIAHAVEMAGRDPGLVLEGLSSFEAGRRPDPDVLARAVAEAWDRAAAETSDDAFGLHLAERLPFGLLDALEHLVRAAPTLGEAMRLALRHQRLLHEGVSLEMELVQTVRVVHRVRRGARASRHAVEAALAGHLIRARRLAGEDLSPLEVTLRHGAPGDVSEHRRTFGCLVRFGEPTDALVLDRSLLDLPASSGRAASPPELHAAGGCRPPGGDDVAGRVRRMLAAAAREGAVSLEAVARRLHMSPRTLQRRLELDRTSFQVLVAEVRQELALGYLADPSLSLAEVSFLVGFSGPSAFHRAFRRWTGTTPLRHRHSAPNGAPPR